MKKTLITGVTGGLGSAVVEYLTAAVGTNQIAVLVRDVNSASAQQFMAQGLEVRVGDYNDKSSLIKAFEGIEQLYFVSSNDLVSRHKQHENVVRAAVEAKVQHIIYTSTVRKNESADAPLYPVVSSHLQTEQWIKASGITYTLLRHNLYAEVILMFAGDRTKIKETKSIYLPVGAGKVAFVARRNFAEAAANILMQASAHENKIYTLSGSEKMNFETVAAHISKTLSEAIAFMSPAVSEFETTLQSVGVPQAIIDLLSQFSQAIADGEFDDDSNDLELLLGRKTDGLADFIKSSYSN
ncbi:SDR family oxidoreductase [Flavobacterium sp. SUN046]|uniref:SDR family oxidoreductase n=1 Tax=Flavobacterium sp. SUN046 TaxID=3002440 RepID=UPI002DB995D9|nr:SDR family oxidoreductase [Flavobacterium sp. SUN046]MEC4049588.1 SDR family oxidoreductase [Flavobacterium sp. SUN046]